MADKDSRAGGAYATPQLLAWLHATHAAHDAPLQRAFDAPDLEGIPAIQVGPQEGRLLTLLMRLVRARRAVEIGTLAGYSAICLARGLEADGHLYTLEYDAKHATVARRNIAGAGLAARITVLEGRAADLLPTLVPHAPFDAVFIDADKGSYDAYGRWAAAHLRPGGLLLGDNAFLFGRLLEESAEGAAMRRFHQEAARSCDTVCLPTPDGLLLGIRRG